MKGLVALIIGLGVAASLADTLSLAFTEVAETVHREVVMAHGYRQAFQAEPSDTNLLVEAERCYQRAIVFTPVLQQIPVKACDVWLEKGTVPDAYRPTLYDAVVHDLLDFYVAVLKAGVKDDDVAVELPAEGPAFEDVEGFCAEIPEAAVRQSRMLRAMRLHQLLLEFHQKDLEQSAFLDADLNRLQFCRMFATGAKRDTRYVSALDRFAYKWRKHEVSARATAIRAALALERGDAAFARMLAQNGAATFSGSIGAAQCRNLIAKVEEPSFEIYAPSIWRAPWPEMTAVYKNLPRVGFRAIRLAENDRAFDRLQGTGGKLGTLIAKTLLKRTPAKAWVMTLPPAADYREREFALAVPKDLPVGRYAVFASTDERFAEDGAPTYYGVCEVRGATEEGERDENIQTGFTHLFGAWERTEEPAEWRYRAWRGTDGKALRHSLAALREREGSGTLTPHAKSPE